MTDCYLKAIDLASASLLLASGDLSEQENLLFACICADSTWSK